MNVKRIKELRLADPFKPFYLIMADGRRLPVERAVFLGISPTGKRLVYSPVEGGFDFLNVDEVSDAVVDETLNTQWNWKKTS
jgi:hypothetical protein